jgi:hypothetical protein
MTKLTEGPFDVHEGAVGLEIHQASDEHGTRPLADVDPENLLPDKEAHALARVFAAAPDLLAACKAALEALRVSRPLSTPKQSNSKEVSASVLAAASRQLHDAIRKAESEGA